MKNFYRRVRAGGAHAPPASNGAELAYSLFSLRMEVRISFQATAQVAAR